MGSRPILNKAQRDSLKPVEAAALVVDAQSPAEVEPPVEAVEMELSIMQSRRGPRPSPTNVNPATVGDGRDETTPQDGRDNA